MNYVNKLVKLPMPVRDGKLPVEAAIAGRRSIREYKEDPVDLKEISQLLWAAQGITRPGGYRTCPSAGALYPLELKLVAGRVDGLASGTYSYGCASHEILCENEIDIRHELARAAFGQSMIARAPVTIAITGILERTTRKYGERGIRYVYMEAGHAAQSLHLQAVALNLGTVVVGAFNDEEIGRVLGLKPDEKPLLLMPFGK